MGNTEYDANNYGAESFTHTNVKISVCFYLYKYTVQVVNTRLLLLLQFQIIIILYKRMNSTKPSKCRGCLFMNSLIFLVIRMMAAYCRRVVWLDGWWVRPSALKAVNQACSPASRLSCAWRSVVDMQDAAFSSPAAAPPATPHRGQTQTTDRSSSSHRRLAGGSPVL